MSGLDENMLDFQVCIIIIIIIIIKNEGIQVHSAV